ncbi:uncharacterized protein PGTG_02443 [Puccinia graminis f. sp. tritici CRL 75-36-700-3]|uniref:Uncharacterized protein n=1 Tax=Puccinia graminis f. sp. tritici (strain CRL 75-36-700-3 / race SCCL) TaxID=418459 RepID=E3JY57_PUCGT|nr:uncharacterized protein PGTG_02443 [Puccinia graminis f. sp. tritici CRL 75-36-700-3]EFP76982.2 hypothetical protein PGTG_02443 [Puccinia graminis f. sp. tritici CRL 75-36-700-3]
MAPLKKKKAIRVQVPTLRPASNKPMPTTSEPDLTAPAIPALDLPVHVTPAHGLPSPPHTQPDSTHDKHPAQDAAALGTSDQDTNTFEELPGPDPRFATVPEELKFYLKPNVELDARPSTKATLLKMIRHFFSEYKPRPLNCHKGVLIRAFEEKISPMIAEYLAFQAQCESQHETDEDEEMQDEAPPKEDLSGINPNNASISVDSIIAMIKRRLPKLQLPTGLNKSSAIGFFHRYLMPPPPGGYPSPFTTVPNPLPKPYHKYLTRDELRFAIQCHCPNIYIPIATGKQVLRMLYEQFVQDDVAEEEVFEGFHYYVIIPK